MILYNYKTRLKTFLLEPMSKGVYVTSVGAEDLNADYRLIEFCQIETPGPIFQEKNFFKMGT